MEYMYVSYSFRSFCGYTTDSTVFQKHVIKSTVTETIYSIFSLVF